MIIIDGIFLISNTMRHTIINYNPCIFLGQNLKIESLYVLCRDIKDMLNFSKMIIEKNPIPLDHKINLSERRISNNHDKFMVFAIGKPSSTSIISYKYHGQDIVESIYNGNGILFHEPIEVLSIDIKSTNNNIFSMMMCDFKYYNVNEFINHKPKDIRSNFHSYYTVI